jgi:membrane fusion protein, multidrug efflux system
MASKTVIRVLSVVLIAAVGGGAWWYQNRAGKPAAGETPAAAAPGAAPAASGAGAGPGAGPGAGRPAGAGGPGGGGKPAVEIATVEQTRLVDEAQSVGSLRSRQGVVIKPEIGGRITQLNFRDGDRVRKGQLLVQFDDQLPAAQIKQAEAELAIAQSQLQPQQASWWSKTSSAAAPWTRARPTWRWPRPSWPWRRATAARLKHHWRPLTARWASAPGQPRRLPQGRGRGGEPGRHGRRSYVDYRLPERFQSQGASRRAAWREIDVDALARPQVRRRVVQAIDPLIDANGRSVGVRACIDNRQHATAARACSLG